MRRQRAMFLVCLTGIFIGLPESLGWLDGAIDPVVVAQEHGSGGHSGASGHSGGKGGGHSGSDGHSESGHSSGVGKGGQGGKGGLRDIYIPGTHGSGSKMLESEVFRSPGGHNRVIAPSEESGRSMTTGRKADTGSGGKPPWAGGAIPEEVELGRLNVARAPEHVLEKARQEVYASFDRDGNGEIDNPEDVRLV
ncbi:MAG: hypothetical protein KC643_06390, partial [Nitrospira sp.]|nr:hypothetical protein [Nitrospira sp.]